METIATAEPKKDEQPPQLRIGLSVLSILGPDLYSNVYAVLSEMIANAWDADAERVKIDISDDEIVIEDDGNGMSLEDINQKFLFIGHRRRSPGEFTVTTVKKRHVMGRKGVGRIAVFAFAKVLSIESGNGIERGGYTLKWDKIQELANHREMVYQPEVILEDSISIHKGTKLRLTGLDHQKTGELKNADELRRRLARRFTVLDGRHDFEVLVNDIPISQKDRPYMERMEFLWYLGEEGAVYLDECPELVRSGGELPNVISGTTERVSGWIGTTKTPSDLAGDNNTIALFAHGKLIQEDILAEFAEGGNFAAYLIGNIEADFMDRDDQPDIVTSDRQRVNKNDPRYKALSGFIHEIVKGIRNRWTPWRNEKGAEQALSVPEYKQWYDRQSIKNKQKVSSLFKKIGDTDVHNQQKLTLFQLIIDQFPVLKDQKGLSSMANEEFIQLLNTQAQTSQDPCTDTAASTSGLDEETTDGSADQDDQASSDSDPEAPSSPGSATPEPETGENDDNPPATPHEFDTVTTPPPAGPDTGGPTQADPFFSLPVPIEQMDDSFLKLNRTSHQEVRIFFIEIKQTIERSKIDQALKNIAIADLRQAYISYSARAYKACAVMLGAVLEGMMLGTIGRTDVLLKLANDPNPPQCYVKAVNALVPPGLSQGNRNQKRNPKLINEIANLRFADYKTIIEYLIPTIKHSQVEDIQTFRNIIHPWKVKSEGEDKKYTDIDLSRAVNLLSALTMISKYILRWNP